MTCRRLTAVASIVLPVLLPFWGCGASAPPKPPASPGSIDVQYESAPAKPAGPAASTFWTGRTDLIAAPPPPKPEALALPKIDRFTLANGMQVIVVAAQGAAGRQLRATAVQAGGYDEDRENLGVSDFVAAMLRKGTKSGSKTRSADDISRAIDFVGGARSTRRPRTRGPRSPVRRCRRTRRSASTSCSDVLLHPSFPESEMGDVRDQMLAAVASRYDNPGELAEAHFDNQLFGEKHPNGWVLTADDVRKIDRAKLTKFWKTFYHPNHAILALAGDVDAAHLRVQLEKAFHDAGRARTRPRGPAGRSRLPPGRADHLLVDRPDLT